MTAQTLGELVPVGGGDNIPLLRTVLTLGRRESCDISLQFPNISGVHCELSFRNGVWQVRDMGSTNGTKVNGNRVTNRPLKPGDEISMAKRKYTIQYQPSAEAMKQLQEMIDEGDDDIMGTSLLEKAGLATGKSRRRDLDD